MHSNCRLREGSGNGRASSIAQIKKTSKKSTSYCRGQGPPWPWALPEYSLRSLPLAGWSKARAFCAKIATVLACDMRCTFVLHSMYLLLLDQVACLLEEGTADVARISLVQQLHGASHAARVKTCEC